MDFILEVKNLYKNYDDVKAVNGISFGVKRGSLFAFLGPNGAGKSTTIKIITTLLKETDGIVTVNGMTDHNYIRNKIGVVFQENVLDKLLTVKENLMIRGNFYLKKEEVTKRYEELAEYLDFKSYENQKFMTLSGGQKRRVEIARALFSNPEILLLDEPTTGLDPETRQIVWKVIDDLKKEKGMTIILTTHYMEEASNADYVVIINKGSIVAEGTPSTLKEAYSKDKISIVPINKETFIESLNERKIDFNKVADQYFIDVDSIDETFEMLEYLRPHIKSFEVLNGSLDDVFIKVIGDTHHE